jgi:hypothetical protein
MVMPSLAVQLSKETKGNSKVYKPAAPDAVIEV